MDCIAHRGFAGDYPENTLPTIRAACEIADGVEVDVRRCGSGELVVVHDETVDRVTETTGKITAFTAEELAALSVEGGDAGIPTFEAVCAAVPPDVTLHAELKEPGLEADLEEIVAGADCRCVVSSFDATALSEVESLPRALLTVDTEGTLERAASLDCAAVHPGVAGATDSFVASAHEAGFDVNVWTVRDPETTRALDGRNVDGVITDHAACCPARTTGD